MSLKKLSAKSSVFAVFRTQLYSMRMVLLLFGVILLVLPSAVTASYATDWMQWHSADSESIIWYIQHILVLYGMVPILGLALVLTIGEFGYLHKRQKLDYFHALPVRRADLYLGRALAALASIFGGALIVALGQTVLLRVQFAEIPEVVYSVIWFDFLMMVFSGFATYLFMVLIAVLTATLWEMLFSLLAVTAAYPVTVFLTGRIVYESIPIASFGGSIVNATLFSPLLNGVCVMMGYDYNNGPWIVQLLAVFLLQIAVCGALSFLFFCKRRSELAENSAAATRFKLVVRFLAAVCGAFLCSFALLRITNAYIAYLIGSVLGAAAAWVIMELLYTHSLRALIDKRRVLKSAAPILTGFAVFAVINVLIAFGFIGVTQLPPPEQINAVAVNGTRNEMQADGSITYSEISGGEHVQFLYTEEGGAYVQMGSFDEKLVQDGYALAQALLENQRKLYYPYHPANRSTADSYDDSMTRFYFYLEFFTENGVIPISFSDWDKNGDCEAIYAKALEIARTPEYIASSAELQMFDILDSITYWDYEKGGRNTKLSLRDIPDREVLIERLKDAYRKDLASGGGSTGSANREYELRADGTQAITLQGGVLDSYYPAEGLQCWLEPVEPGEGLGVVQSGVSFYIAPESYPNTAAIFDALFADQS